MAHLGLIQKEKYIPFLFVGIILSFLSFAYPTQGVEGNQEQASYSSSEKSEQWDYILDNGQGSGNLIFYEIQAGNVYADGNWEYTHQGMTGVSTFTEAIVSISGKNIQITVTGIAESPTAPPGYNTSPYTLIITGEAYNGQGNGTFVITYQTFGWPDRISGVWEGGRISGGGITEEEVQVIKYLPWIYLLLKK